MDSPRGRIVLMRVGHEQGTEVSAEMTEHFDRCLGCMACVTACPSGVQYDRLIEQVAPADRAPRRRAPRARAAAPAADLRALHPPRPAARARAAAWRCSSGSASTDALGRARSAQPRPARDAAARAAGDAARRAPAAARGHARAAARRAGRVALHAGLRPARRSSATSTPPPCACSPPRAGRSTPRASRAAAARCMLHAGVEDDGAGAGPRDDRGLRGLRLRRRQRRRLRLGDEGLRPPARRRPGVGRARGGVLGQGPRRARAARRRTSRRRRGTRSPLKVAYHDACHLAHAQGVRAQPRELLRGDPRRSSWSSPPTGSCAAARPASTTSSSPRPPRSSAQRKAANLAATGAEAIAAANPGCAIQIARPPRAARSRSTTR